MATASYLRLHEEGRLAERVESARALLSPCAVCPRRCGGDRHCRASGTCRTGDRALVTAFHPHFGEEAPLVGRRGSGTIFFGSCSLRCVFCQNWTTSRLEEGGEVTSRELAAMMVALERAGCHNVNLVTPTHVVPQILAALPDAIELGLSVPLVYNSSGYDRVETLRLLDGIVDIYMPDVKFADAAPAGRYCSAPDYPGVARDAVREMHRQVGDLVTDASGLAVRGLLVRHLVMPGGVAGTREVCRFVAREISSRTYVNVMSQYRPCGEAERFPEIARRITQDEFREAVQAARQEGLERLD